MKFVTAASVVIFLVGEIDSPKGLVIVIAGLIARRQIMKWWDALTDPHEGTSGWAYKHSAAWAISDPDHGPLNPTKCPTCRP